jgi:signal transduction histidine kinase/BarA-like signal transduction histidine kinase
MKSIEELMAIRDKTRKNMTVREDTGEVIGAICMEMDMEHTYKLLEQSNRAAVKMAMFAAIVLVLFALGAYCLIQKSRTKSEEQQEQLQKAVEAADAANEAKSVFLFNVSHDIRTPMNAIIGYAELADRNLDKKELLRSYLEKIGICGQKMLSILDNVLELSRIETGNVVLEESAAEAESVLDDCLHMVSAEIEKKHQTLTISKDIIYPYIYMDISRFTEIILNLISNAIKYTGEGGTIRCSVRQLPAQKDGRCIQELSVSDNGIGMSEEFQKHIFESFTRERSSTVSGVEGTGLGMGIVKKLVEMMHGEIKIHSRVGEGSTFTIRIPCRIAAFEDTQTKRAQVHPNGKPLAGKRILLAEDNDLNAEIAIALLEEEGLLVERAADGVKCMEMLEKAPAHFYDLILMDIQMPILGGYDTTRKIRRMADAEKAAIPIIAMTANAFAEDKQRALAAGMNDHVAKPIDMNKLIPTLQKYI